MINELYELSKSLERHCLLQSTTHKDISNVGAAACLRIEINSNGIPKTARYGKLKPCAAFWRHSNSTHRSFPAIRVQRPLLARSESEKINGSSWSKSSLSEKRELLSQLDYSLVNSDCRNIEISKWSLSELNPVLTSVLPELAALKQLLSVFPQEGQSSLFCRDLAMLLQQEIVHCQQEDYLDFLKLLLVGKKESKDDSYTARCMTYYDVYETDSYENLVYSAETRYALIKLLNIPEREHNLVVSPLSGEKVTGVGDKYPEPNLPALGPTYFYARNTDIPSLSRYRLPGTRAFQAGKDEMANINNAIEFLTDKARHNKSWRYMSNSDKEGPNLLLAYLPDDPNNNAYLARVLDDLSDSDDLDEFREAAEPIYDALCEQVLGKLEDVLRKNPRTRVQLIILEKIDKGHRQVAYESSITAERLRENLITWNTASKNCPPVEIRVRDKKKTRKVKPICPGPNGICQLLKVSYTRSDSAKPMRQSDASLHEIYSLYMPDSRTERSDGLLDRFLTLAVQKSGMLLGDIGCKQTVEDALPSTKQSRTRAKQGAEFVSLLSILLYQKKIRKEDYMLDAPFNVGQFLKLSDMLHKEYCVQVRNSGNRQEPIYPQLMGNEMLAIASENPIEGLNRLRDRMRIYLAWASTATGENTGLAKWILARFEEVSLRIAQHELPPQFGPAEQAQVLLGYLSAIPYEKKNKDDNSAKEENPNE